MARNLITLADYKQYAGISSVEFDNKLQALVTMTSEFVKTYCNRMFIDGYDPNAAQFLDITEFTNYEGYYYPNEFPINSLVKVEVSLDNGTTYTQDLNCVFDRSREAIYIPEEGREGMNLFKVVYTGGFKTTPEDLKLACLDLVEYYHKAQSTPMKNTMNTTIEYVSSDLLPAHIKRVLDQYRVLI